MKVMLGNAGTADQPPLTVGASSGNVWLRNGPIDGRESSPYGCANTGDATDSASTSQGIKPTAIECFVCKQTSRLQEIEARATRVRSSAGSSMAPLKAHRKSHSGSEFDALSYCEVTTCKGAHFRLAWMTPQCYEAQP